MSLYLLRKDSDHGKRNGACLVLALSALALSPLSPATAQIAHHRPGTAVVPHSSEAQPNDAGRALHTNVRFVYMNGSSPTELPPFAGYGYETPASFACLYKLVRPVQGCNPNLTTTNSSEGSQAIAIVDAYDDPNAAADLAFFSSQFGLPYSDSNFKVVYAQGPQPPEDPTGGWEFEESLDIEYAHAMAPNAKLYLVEANSNLDSDLFPAILVASNLVSCGSTSSCPKGSKGKGQVSMSFAGAEFAQEASLDPFFTTPNVEYFGAAGDSPGVEYPCASPNVICVGGTSTARSEFTGNLIAEIAWSDAGGGISSYEPIPRYQATYPGLNAQLQGFRGVPDVSADANLNTGAWVWDTFPYGPSAEAGWFIAGGTSLATPLTAGIFNATGSFGTSSNAELSEIYSLRSFGSFRDITYGACGYYSGSFSSPGWDLCTGFGSPAGLDLR
ncbi:MAG TPA: S53 family peptidase [Terracidiphilus sp.]|nr:S53 family peptidase [Terracidiphilus sp.]